MTPLFQLRNKFLLLVFLLTASLASGAPEVIEVAKEAKQIVPEVKLAALEAKQMAAKAAKPGTSEKASPVVSVKSREKVPVELEWEAIPGAKLYELEFQSLSGQKVSTFKSSSNVFKFKMKVGRYKVRSRVADERRVFGSWSALNEFAVEPKAPVVNEKASRTTGKIDPKTLKADVAYQWGAAPGAERYKLNIYDSNGTLIHEEVTVRFQHRLQLPPGEYSATLIALGPEGINSKPVPLPGKVVIQGAKLSSPEILFEANSHLPVRGDVPLLRWKPRTRSVVSGELEYRFFFGEEWIPVQNFKQVKAQEILLDKAMKPGRYRISLWSESSEAGLIKSAPTVYEFVVKPKVY